MSRASLFTTVLTSMLIGAAGTAQAQAPVQDSTKSPARNISGPRVGFTVLTPALVNRVKEEFDRDHLFPVLSLFGWQRGVDVASNNAGGAAVVQGLIVFAGADQGLFLPSVTMLIGARSGTGVEFGLGPSLSLTGVGVAIGAGATKKSGNINIPMNVAVVTAAEGLRFSFLSGFNWISDR
jgi:hypothetical protein